MQIHSPRKSTHALVKVDYLQTLPRAKRAYRLLGHDPIQQVMENGEVDGMLEIFASLSPSDQTEIFDFNAITEVLNLEHPERARKLLDVIEALPVEMRVHSLSYAGHSFATRGFAKELFQTMKTLELPEQRDVAATGKFAWLTVVHGGEAALRDFMAPWPEDAQRLYEAEIKRANEYVAAHPEQLNDPTFSAVREANRLTVPLRNSGPRKGKPYTPQNG